ncbi:MAG: Na+/H+ antiporter NhaA [Melioribacteraceae bacterium]|nr:Na+/H+ antiporter NhaA [Melioribacteraceae bacterium]
MQKENNNNPPIERIMKPFQEFLHAETSGGVLLIIATIIALIFANSALSEFYYGLWHTEISIGIGEYALTYDLHHWINDGLMAIFFFVVGLEIKRELLAGELSTGKKASLPIAAAVGGMLVPALLYILFNAGNEGASGWGIPMATDIAFVIGILALLGSKVPISLKVFVTALAIADDIGAVLVIAFFYTAEISFFALGIAGIFIVLLILVNLLGIRNLLIYTLLGIGLWLAFLKSGVHATVAGVLLAFTIPASSRISTREFLIRGKDLLTGFENAGEEETDILTNSNRQAYIQKLESHYEKIMSPLQRFEHGLHPWIAFFIIPLFAFANAGVTVGDSFFDSLINPISIGIIAGLFLRKAAWNFPVHLGGC